MTPEQIAEAQRLAIAFQIALARVGGAAIYEAIRLFMRLNPANLTGTVGPWLDDVTAMIASRRSVARDLAVAYYRLASALEQGTTIPPLDGETDAAETTLDELRANFRELAESAGEPEVAADDPAFERIDWDFLGRGGNAPVAMEPIESREEFNSFIEELDEDAIDQAVELLVKYGPENFRRKMTGDSNVVDMQAAFQEANTRQAATVDRLVKNGGRGPVFHLIDRDKGAMGYVRISRTGTPCGWCAALISRGFVYKSEDSAGYSEGDLYHDNCKCVAMPVYRQDQYRTADVFALNREYQKSWPIVTKGLKGKEAMSAWRKYIRLMQGGMSAEEALAEVRENGVRPRRAAQAA